MVHRIRCHLRTERAWPEQPQGILAERHGISIDDAAVLLAAMTSVRGVTPHRMAKQIIDATVEPGSYPTPLGISFVDPAGPTPHP